MTEKPSSESLIAASEHLRDNLANDRTVLANERTLLAYIRTALTMFIAGATFIKFFDHLALALVGWVFIPLSVITVLVGGWSYRRTARAIHHSICEENPPD